MDSKSKHGSTEYRIWSGMKQTGNPLLIADDPVGLVGDIWRG